MLHNVRGFHVEYKGATNTDSSKVIIRDMRFRKSIAILYNYDYDNVAEIAEDYLSKRNIVCVAKCEATRGYILISNDFTNQVKD